jgi:transcriptional regulator with XRE-family HTH domain
MERLGFFSEKLKDSMVRFNLSQQSTAARLGCSYEHVRKMVRGECLPSQELLRKLCSIFECEITAIEKLYRLDDARRRFGPTFWTVLGKDPRAEPFYILWPYLSREERNIMIISMSGCIAARKNKTTRRKIRAC